VSSISTDIRRSRGSHCRPKQQLNVSGYARHIGVAQPVHFVKQVEGRAVVFAEQCLKKEIQEPR
jgi:hypothetical protein